MINIAVVGHICGTQEIYFHSIKLQISEKHSLIDLWLQENSFTLQILLLIRHKLT